MTWPGRVDDGEDVAIWQLVIRSGVVLLQVIDYGGPGAAVVLLHGGGRVGFRPASCGHADPAESHAAAGRG